MIDPERNHQITERIPAGRAFDQAQQQLALVHGATRRGRWARDRDDGIAEVCRIGLPLSAAVQHATAGDPGASTL